MFAHLADSMDPDQLAIQLISFGFKYGLPLEADLVFDVRFMQNPYYIDELRTLSGLTERGPRSSSWTSRRRRASWPTCTTSSTSPIPAYVAEGKTRLTIGIGCTGGYHRSIAIAEEVAAWLRRAGLRDGRGVPPRARAGLTDDRTIRAASAPSTGSAAG